ncbi:MAG: hypothetical protein AB1750_09665 [Chloroflexota bacterium]
MFLVVSLLFSACRQGRRPGNGGGAPPTKAAPTASAPETSAPGQTVAPEALTFQTGRNDYTVNVDDTPRKFIVHVPV